MAARCRIGGRRNCQSGGADARQRHGTITTRSRTCLFTQEGDVVNVVGWWWKDARRFKQTHGGILLRVSR